MGFRLQFEGIRCFVEPQDAVVRPLTLLVGENSSGKSTFLALCRIAHAIAQRSPLHVPFNEAPFSLGAYDQIASKRPGRHGNVRSFSLTVSVGDEFRQSLLAEFVPRSGQPLLHVFRLASNNVSFEVAANEPGRSVITVRDSDGEKRVAVGPESNVPAYRDDFLLMAVMHTPIDEWRSLAERGKRVLSESSIQSLEKARQAIQQEFRREPYAFAPVRTNPKRTYDPVDSASDPEGSHVPMILATLARSATQKEWAALQSSLTEFGADSRLFEGIEIVNKGKKESDPFQIGLKVGGPVFNLIDVGYGVSQALPILVDILRRSSPFELFLIQQPEVHLHPRAQAELGSFFARQAESNRRLVIETHSDHLVDRVRMEVRNRVLQPEDVSLLYFERQKHGAVIHNLELDKYGSITNAPPGYREFFLKEERSLLGV